MTLQEYFSPLCYVTLKATAHCNMGCQYCKVDAVPPKGKANHMELDTAKKAVRLLIENSELDDIWINFHGGEPLLLDDAWLEEVINYARELAEPRGKTLNFPVATNGTLLSEERLLKLHDMGLMFSMSMDGPPHIHDRQRRLGQKVLDAWRLFKKHDIRVGIMAVIHQSNWDAMDEVMDFYAEEGIRQFLSNVVEAQGRGEESQLLSPEQMLQASWTMLEHMDRTDCAVINDEVMRKVSWFLMGRKDLDKWSCFNLECHAGRRMISVDVDGSITTCGSADTSDFCLGNIHEAVDKDTVDTVMHRFHHKDTWFIRCFDCAARPICTHGCTTAGSRSENYRENLCQATRQLWTRFCEQPEVPARVFAAMQQRGGPTA